MSESTATELRDLLKSLKRFSVKDLEAIREKTDETIEKKRERERNDAIKKAREIMETYRITADELAPEGSPSDDPSR